MFSLRWRNVVDTVLIKYGGPWSWSGIGSVVQNTLHLEVTSAQHSPSSLRGYRMRRKVMLAETDIAFFDGTGLGPKAWYAVTRKDLHSVHCVL